MLGRDADPQTGVRVLHQATTARPLEKGMLMPLEHRLGFHELSRRLPSCAYRKSRNAWARESHLSL